MAETVDKNKENKKTIKVAIISIVCTLLLVAVILLIVIFGLKNCSNRNSNNSSDASISSSGQTYDYAKLDSAFKKIVSKQLLADSSTTDQLDDVLAVTYTDNGGSFNLDISVRNTSKVYYYHLSNSTYTGYNNFVSYILDVDFDNVVGIPLDGDEVSVGFLSITADTITTDKVCRYAITEDGVGGTKYFDGFYFENNQYHVYQKKELVGSNPFGEPASKVIPSNDLLYGYYQSLLS